MNTWLLLVISCVFLVARGNSTSLNQPDEEATRSHRSIFGVKEKIGSLVQSIFNPGEIVCVGLFCYGKQRITLAPAPTTATTPTTSDSTTTPAATTAPTTATESTTTPTTTPAATTAPTTAAEPTTPTTTPAATTTIKQ